MQGGSERDFKTSIGQEGGWDANMFEGLHALVDKSIYSASESQIAVAFIEFVKFKYPAYSQHLIKIDNENRCSWAEGKLKKRQGKIKGASDYFFAMPKMVEFHPTTFPFFPHCDAVYYGLFLELKSKKGKESNEQKAFGKRMLEAGYLYKCAYGLDEAIEVFEQYIGPK